MLSREFCEISKNTYFKEHLRWLLLIIIFTNVIIIIFIMITIISIISIRGSLPEVFLYALKIWKFTKFTGEHPCRSVISIKLLCSFIEIALRHGCSPVNLLHIFRILFPKSTYGGLLL